MIETDQQRRWWFATHPEYSHRSSGRRGAKDDKSDKLDPEKVDAWADERLKHEKDPVAIELLQQAKFWFGTEFASKPPGQQYALLGEEKPVGSDALFGDKSNGVPPPSDAQTREKNRQMMLKYIREEVAPSTDLRRAFDVLPLGRALSLITRSKLLQRLFRLKGAKDAVVGVVEEGGGKGKTGIKGKDGDKTENSGKRSARLPLKGTPERNAIEAARQKGIDAKKAQEREAVRSGGKGSGNWTEQEREGIKQTGEFPPDTQWHHDPTVANRPDLAADPSVVHIIRGGRSAHFDAHDRDWRKPLK